MRIWLHPKSPLKPDTRYAVMLTHHALAVPAALLEAELTWFGSDGLIANDFLSYFRTQSIE